MKKYKIIHKSCLEENDVFELSNIVSVLKCGIERFDTKEYYHLTLLVEVEVDE